MNSNNFYKPLDVKDLYGEIIPTYQIAFAGDPWYEVSKCADQLQRCADGLSSLAVGTSCQLCGLCPVLPAYENKELENHFNSLGSTRPTAWYVEQSDHGVNLASVAWKAIPQDIAKEKYPDNTAITQWLIDTLGYEEIMWLDEVFANKTLKPKGNLQNFGKFVTGMANMLDTRVIAYRTIEPRMVTVSKRDFGNAARVYARQISIPDRRDFVVITLKEDEECAF